MNCVIVTKQNVKLDDKVVKGRDWRWDSQGGFSRYGTVIRNENYGWVHVLWENGETNSYRIGAEDFFDLYFYTKELTPSLINRIGHLL